MYHGVFRILWNIVHYLREPCWLKTGSDKLFNYYAITTFV